MKRYNIQVDFIVEAGSEGSAEQKVWEFIKHYNHELLTWDIIDWDFLEFGSLPEGEHDKDVYGY